MSVGLHSFLISTSMTDRMSDIVNVWKWGFYLIFSRVKLHSTDRDCGPLPKRAKGQDQLLPCLLLPCGVFVSQTHHRGQRRHLLRHQQPKVPHSSDDHCREMHQVRQQYTMYSILSSLLSYVSKPNIKAYTDTWFELAFKEICGISVLHVDPTKTF